MSIFQVIYKNLVITLIFIPHCIKSKTVDTTTITNDIKTNGNETYETNVNNESVIYPNADANVTCRGAPIYCNYTKEVYIQMLDNYIFPSPHEWGLIAIHSVVFAIGLVGNALVCIAVFRNSSMKSSVTYRCLVNLAAADFLVILLCLPPTVVWDVTETWFLGEFLCKTLVYLQSVSVTVSVLTLTYIALGRYNATARPIEFHIQSTKSTQVKIAIAVIWLIALVFNCPDLIYLTTTQQPLRFELPHLTQCVSTWAEEEVLIWNIVKFVFMYTIPLLLIAGAYLLISLRLWKSGMIPGQADSRQQTHEAQHQRSRRNVAKMLVVVVVMFAVCYLPVHVLALLRYTGVLDTVNDHNAVSVLALVSHVLCYINSAINPVIYNFMSEKFRHEFRRAFCCSAGYVHEHSTTMTLTTNTKSKKSSVEMQSLTHKPEKNGYT